VKDGVIRALSKARVTRSASASLTAGSAANDQSGYSGVLVKQGIAAGRSMTAVKSALLPVPHQPFFPAGTPEQSPPALPVHAADRSAHPRESAKTQMQIAFRPQPGIAQRLVSQ
jgi:hypothetical protein